MASLPALPRIDAALSSSRAFIPRGRRMWAVVMLALVLLLRLVPGESLVALDRGGGSDALPGSTVHSLPEQPGESFPGSAYFLAQDAFTTTGPAASQTGDPAVTALPAGQHSPHVLQIDNGPAALSMPMRGLTLLDRARALQCMTNAIYYEAGNEPEEGQRAVAQVILNRLASGRWPDSVCGVVYQGTERSDRLCQFTFSCDGSMARSPAAAAWSRARGVAGRMLAGEVFAPAGLATFYHTLAVRPPWVDRVKPVAVVGAHIFYRLPGEAGMPAAYRMRYSGREIAFPGPYAFAPPLQFLPPAAPPGPEFIAGWTSTAVTPAETIIDPRAPAVALPKPSPAPFVALPLYAGRTGAIPPPAHQEPDTDGLPQSTIRPEYRNSGRPLH